MSDITKTVGKRLKMIRLFHEIKQKELADELGVNAPLLSMYEKGDREPPLSFLEKFCNRFNMSLSQFFSFSEQEQVINKLPENKAIRDLHQIFNVLEELTQKALV